MDSCYSVEKGKKIVLKCEVIDPNVQVKWLKNGQEIKPSAKYKRIKPQTHPHTDNWWSTQTCFSFFFTILSIMQDICLIGRELYHINHRSLEGPDGQCF